MYRYNLGTRSKIRRNECTEGETIETKVKRLVHNKEPIQDGAPVIFTERKDGVVQAYNIRTDRWEVAAEAMDIVTKSRVAKRDGKAGMPESMKESNRDKEVGGAESTQGKADGTESQSK